MQASRPSPRYRSPRLAVALAVLLLTVGCAGGPVGMPRAPDEAVLAPAEQALARAQDAQAADFAPRALDAARRRITTAREILYAAARRDRALTETERRRVEQLVAAARLDARSALVQTQAGAVTRKLEELRGRGRPVSTAPRAATTGDGK